MLGHLYCGLRKGGVLKIYIKISIILLLAVLVLSFYLWIGTQNWKTYQKSNIWYERIYERIQRGKVQWFSSENHQSHIYDLLTDARSADTTKPS